MSTVHLIDASPYIFRAFFSIKGLTAPDGHPAGAVYGYAATLLKLAQDEDLSHVALTYDRSLTTSFRNDFYPAYKAQRDLPPPELEAQIDGCFAMGEALGMRSYIDDRYEADDLIAALLADLGAAEEIVIVSSDKDLAQLVDERVTLWDYARDQRYDPEAVRRKLGVRPAQVADFLGLAGDSVDNIPGVKGVGKKTAGALLAHFDDLDDLYARLDEVAELPIRGAKSLGAKLAAQRDEAFLSRRLATVAEEAPASASVEDLAWAGADREAFDALCARWGFENLHERVPRWQ